VHLGQSGSYEEHKTVLEEAMAKTRDPELIVRYKAKLRELEEREKQR
jgi:hypothetical protein